MSTFTKAEQSKCREAFIRESREKAWGAACHADYIAQQSNLVAEEYQKVHEEDQDLERQIKDLENAVDSHTKDNRDQRKQLQERRNDHARRLQALAQQMNQAEQALRTLYGNVENNLALAKHADEWEWKEASSESKS